LAVIPRRWTCSPRATREGGTTFNKDRATIMRTTRIKIAPTARRFSHLKAMLERRRSELAHELRDRIRAVRSDGHAHRDVLDDAEGVDVDIQEDIGFAVIQLKTDTLTQIDAALRRLEDGHYGNCFECGGDIGEARLRALPFAVRCRSCEQSREAAGQRERFLGQRRGATALFVDL
jgi:DnaK suppressor protein